MMDEPKPFLEHLDELRGRLIVVLVAVALLAGGCYAFVDRIIGWLAKPTGGFVFLSLTEAFLVRLKISMVLGAFLGAPIMIYEIWRFVGVALAPAERRLTLSILPVSYCLFLAGAACAWFAVIPTAVRFLLGFATENLKPLLSIDVYVGFAAWLTVAFGAMFQLPVVVFFMVKAGIATPDSLAAYRRHVILGLAILAALLTPGPDLFSQMALLIPTYLLYEISIWIARWTYRKEDQTRRVEDHSLSTMRKSR